MTVLIGLRRLSQSHVGFSARTLARCNTCLLVASQEQLLNARPCFHRPYQAKPEFGWTAAHPVNSSLATLAKSTTHATTPKFEMQLFGETWKVVPKVFVFDVDNTLWPYWCDTDLRPPFAPGPDGKLHDGGGKAIELFSDVRSVMLDLHRAGARVAFASRTDQPSWLENIARQMKLTEDTSLWDVAEFHEIYSTSKHEHFHAIKRQSGCPHDAMLFFDDEARNRNVEELGVTFVDAEGGLTQEMVKAGLREYERRHID